MRPAGTSLRVFWSLGIWIFIAHVFACTWFILGWFSRCTLYDDTWVSSYWPQLPLDACPSPNASDVANASLGTAAAIVPSAVDDSEILDAALAAAQEVVPWPTMYVSCLYWALSTTSSLGYGEGPRGGTPLEMSMSICCQVMGACISAAIFGNIAQLLAQRDAVNMRYKAQQEKINQFAEFHTIGSSLRQKLHAYNRLLFSVQGCDAGQISAGLPPNVRTSLAIQINARLVRSVPLFADCEEGFIKSLVGILRPQVRCRLVRANCDTRR